MTLNTIATNIAPCTSFVPTAAAEPIIPPAVTFIDSAAEEDGQAPAAVGNIFEALLPNACRADVPAANDEASEGESGSRARAVFANATLRRTMAVRLVRARLLSGMSQGDVSKALGFKNQTQVALWEQGRRLIPMTDLVRIAGALGVNEGYLLGTADEPEKDQAAALRNACLRGVRKQLERVAEMTVDTVAAHARQVGPHAGHMRDVLAAGDALLEAFGSFSRANMTVFEGQRGSATLLKRTQDLETSLEAARAAIRLHDALDSDLRRALADITVDDEAPVANED